MSTRAYRVNNIEYKQESTGSFGDSEFYDLFCGEIREDNTMELTIDQLKNKLEQAECEFTKKQLLDDIKWAEDNEREEVLYHLW